MSHKEQIIIGIDPDVDRNGIAMLDMSTHSLQVQMLTFPNLLDFIKEKYRQFAEIDKWDFKVIIEAGWMNRGNYHIQRWQGKQGASPAWASTKDATNRSAEPSGK
jgi:hypothetical protein